MRHRAADLPDDARAWLDDVARNADAGWFQPSGTIGPIEEIGRIGAIETIEQVRRLAGATSSEVFAFDLAEAGLRRRLVLRWYAEDGVLAEEPDLVEREVAALRVLAGTGVRAPALVASGPRAVLMTHIRGGIRLALPDPGALRDALTEVHGLDPTTVAHWRYAGYHEGLDLPRPSWWRDADAWDRAVRQTETARPSGPDVFIHRDFHPGNVLWNGRWIRGIVDWASACAGPATFDYAHCRVNLAVLWGQAAADDLAVIDPAWDIEAAFGFLDWDPARLEAWPGRLPRTFVEGGGPDLSPGVIRERLESFVVEALARLG
jgi:hypothetical protein